MKKISNILITILFIILLINLILLIEVNVFKLDYPNIFGYTYFEVLTGSMKDTLNEQDIIIVKLTTDIDVGDIITFKDNSSYVTHRVVSIDKEKVTTKGDNNNTEDNPINRSDVIGKVVYDLKGMGIILKVITDKITIILLLLVILSISYFDYLRKENRDERKNSKV